MMSRLSPCVLAALLMACGPKGGGVENPAASAESGASDAGETGDENPELPAAPTSAEAASVDTSDFERVNAAVALLDPSSDKHDPAAAKTLLSKVVTDNPDLAIAHLNLGVAKHQLGDLAGARSSYTRAGDLDGTLGHVTLYMGRLQEQADRPDLALEQYRKAIAENPDDIVLREALVSGLVEAGELDRAIEEAKSALQVNTQSIQLYNSLGLAYLNRGEAALARFVYEKARNTVQGADENAAIHANLGRVLRMQEDLPNARFHLTKAVELDDRYLPALVYLSDLYMEDRNYGDASGLLEKARALDPRNFWVLVNLGVAYRGMQEFDKAQAAYEAAMAINAENPDPHFNLGILNGDHRKEYADGIKALETYVAMGGAEAERANEYIESLQKEKRRADRRKQREEARKAAEAEAAERQRLLEQEQGAGGESPDGESPQPEAPQGDTP